MKIKEWTAFGLLGIIWGSSFLWIKIAVDESREAVALYGQPFGSFMLVAFRLLFGLIGLLIIMRWQKQAFTRDRNILLAFVFMGVFNTAVPFVLITWGEKSIDSGLASILNGAVPLFTIVIAHFWLHDEKITAPRIAGLIVGFVGIVVLVSRDFDLGGVLKSSIWGQAAVLLASISYATAITFSRKYLRGQPPVLQSTMVLLIADSLIWISTPIAAQVAPNVESLILPTNGLRWFAVVWLGVLGSCIAYILFFYLNNVWGPTRASLVTYVFPVIGLFLGILFLNEAADWRLVVGSLLVVGGIGVVNLNLKPKAVVLSSPVAE
jgi:drug/metabolite transporter (DMT)-like permease